MNNTVQDFVGTGPLLSPALTVTSPNGDETFQAGSPATITWTSTNPTGDVYILLLKAGQSYSVIGSAAMSANSLTWNICPQISNGTDYKVSIFSPDTGAELDRSDNSFQITGLSPPPPPKVTGPNGGETLRAGSTTTITWTSTNLAGDADIYLLKGGQFYSWIGWGQMSAGSFTWNISPQIGNGSDYTIQIWWNGCVSLSDSSDNPFSIAPPSGGGGGGGGDGGDGGIVDTDKDGVPDGIDKCANTPAGQKVDANGCPLAQDQATQTTDANGTATLTVTTEGASAQVTITGAPANVAVKASLTGDIAGHGFAGIGAGDGSGVMGRGGHGPDSCRRDCTRSGHVRSHNRDLLRPGRP